MSDMIQVARNPVERSWVAQQEPSVLIRVTEEPRSTYWSPLSFRGAGQESLIQLSAVSKASMTVPASVVIIMGADYPTSGLTVASGEESINRIRPEWSSTGIANAWVRWLELTKELLQKHDLESRRIPSASAKLRVERLTQIQAKLGLPMQALAEILRITRQNLYKWLDVTKDIMLQEASQHRLSAIERVADLWRYRSTAPLSSVANELTVEGYTVVDMLKNANLDETAIIRAFDELAEKLSGKPKSLSQRMAEAGFTRRPSVRTLGPDE